MGNKMTRDEAREYLERKGKDAINELEDTGHIEILDTQLDEKEYREIIEKFKQTKSDFLHSFFFCFL